MAEAEAGGAAALQTEATLQAHEPAAARPSVAPATEGGAGAEAGEGPALLGQDWAFPVLVAGPRRLSPDDVLFEAGNLERERLAKQAAWREAKDEQAHLAREAELHDRSLASYLTHKFECVTCRACLPTSHLLDIHVAEVHDSFFAAQAARRLPVFLCLVEGCGRKFCTAEERRQHLVDHHKFPKGRLGLDRIHLRRKKGQIRVLPEYRKSSNNGRQALQAAKEEAAAEEAGNSPGAAGSAPAAAAAQPAAGEPGSKGSGEGDGPTSMEEDVAHGLSRLSMAAESSWVPSGVSFGRRSAGRGLPGLARGRGERKSGRNSRRMEE